MNASEDFANRYGPHFTWDEFKCKCGECDPTNMWYTEPEFAAFMFKLIKLRNILGWPFIINSGYRCPAYNDSLYDSDGTHLDGPHTLGGADVKCSFERAYQLVDYATHEKMGIGIKQHGPVAKRFLHLDNLGHRIWTYP